MPRPVTFQVHGQCVRLAAPSLHQRRVTAPDDQAPLPVEAAPPRPAMPAPLSEAHRSRTDALMNAIAARLVEVLQGRRSGTQLALWMRDDCHHLLLAWSRQRSWKTTSLVSTRACRVDARTVEGSALLREGDLVFSLALRLEHERGRWLVTILEVIQPPAGLVMRAG